jgi:hypothetical protein
MLASVKEWPGPIRASRTGRVPAVLDRRSTRTATVFYSGKPQWVTWHSLLKIYTEATCAPLHDWPSRNTALRITTSFRMTAVTTYLNG